jgi:hypothetical protein
MRCHCYLQQYRIPDFNSVAPCKVFKRHCCCPSFSEFPLLTYMLKWHFRCSYRQLLGGTRVILIQICRYMKSQRIQILCHKKKPTVQTAEYDLVTYIARFKDNFAKNTSIMENISWRLEILKCSILKITGLRRLKIPHELSSTRQAHVLFLYRTRFYACRYRTPT